MLLYAQQFENFLKMFLTFINFFLKNLDKFHKLCAI